MKIHTNRYTFAFRLRTSAGERIVKFPNLKSREAAAGAFMRAYGYEPADDDYVWVERYVSKF